MKKKCIRLFDKKAPLCWTKLKTAKLLARLTSNLSEGTPSVV